MKHKGISIVIPVYNFSITDLVKTLSQQAITLDVPFEIRCYDDDSNPTYKDKNREIASLEHVIYKELETNHGRSKIRNLLAFEAQYDSLLFIDGDSKITNNCFLENYLEHIDGNTVVYGGRTYQNSPPTDNNKLLHWKYGSERETLKAEERSKSPYYSFMSNNFIAPKDFFLQVKMDETLKGYGYEDTLFGITLKEFNIDVKHIDNPLCHIGLEDNEVFLHKTYESVKNLFVLTSKNIRFNTKLYRYYKLITKSRLTFLFHFFYNLFQRKIEYNLKSEVPSLIYFDIYKLKLMLLEHHKNN